MAGKTQIGTRAITKKMFGTREITKEVVNGVVVYEKQASGYTLTLTGHSTVTGYDDTDTYIKVNSAPTSASDYTAYQEGTGGGQLILNTGVTNPISNVTKVYMWGFRCTLNNTQEIELNHNAYNTAVELTLTENSNLYIEAEVS